MRKKRYKLPLEYLKECIENYKSLGLKELEFEVLRKHPKEFYDLLACYAPEFSTTRKR